LSEDNRDRSLKLSVLVLGATLSMILFALAHVILTINPQVFLLADRVATGLKEIIKILQNTEVRELGLRDIVAVAGGVLKGGAA